MRILGVDMNEQVPITRGRLVGFAGMLFTLTGMLVDETFAHPAASILGIVFVSAGIVLIGIGLLSLRSKASPNQAPTGTKS